MEEDGEHSPKTQEEVFSNRPNMENKGQRDRGSDPMWSGGKNSRLVSDPWEHTNKKLSNLVCTVLQSQPVLKINSRS